MKTAKWHHFQLHILHKTAEPMVKFISHMCGKLQLAVRLSREDETIYRLPKHSWMSDKPQKQATAKQPEQPSAPIPTWTEYSHCVMVKTVSAAVCMNASFSQIQSQNYIHVHTHVAIILCKLHENVLLDISSGYYIIFACSYCFKDICIHYLFNHIACIIMCYNHYS